MSHQGGDVATRLAARLTEFAPEVLRATETPGLSFAVAHRNQQIYSGAFGFADIASGLPMSTSSCFRVGSLTKLFTATAALQLADIGAIDLTQPVIDSLPRLKLRNPIGGRDVTAIDLLTFTSGLIADLPDATADESPALGDYVRAKLAANEPSEYRGRDTHGRRVRPWAACTGEAFQYSNLGIAILGHLIEQRNPERLSFARYVTRNILEPLGLKSTFLPAGTADCLLPRPIREHLAQGHARLGPLLVPTPEIHGGLAPATAMVSNPEDLLQWLLMMLSGGELDGKRILSRHAVAQMLTPHVVPGGRFGAQLEIGLVVEIHDRGHRSWYFGEGGAFPFGWRVEARAYPDRNLAVVVAINKWDLPSWFNPPARSPLGILPSFIIAELDAIERGTPLPPPRSWDWKLSYVSGFLLAERTNGVLARRLPLNADALIRAAASVSGPVPPRSFVPDGFRAGVEDADAVDLTPVSIAAFLRSERLRVPASDLPTIAFSLAASDLQVPMAYFADRGGS